MAYLDRRGLGREIARRFELGYAPNERTALRRAFWPRVLRGPLLAAGLLAQADGGGEGFDRFRHRIMFPIADERGQIVGFGGRALGDARAKYLNTSETELFHKGELLYNLHRAAKPARERREVVLAEGYMDVIALAQAGLGHAVAPSARRLPSGSWRCSGGWPRRRSSASTATVPASPRRLRAAERALPLMRGGQTLRFAVLPDGEDPDSYLRRHGAEALTAVLSKAHTLSRMIWRLETQGRRFDEPEARAALSRRLRGLAQLAGDPDLRTSLLDQFRTLQQELVAATAPVAARSETPAGEAFRLGGRRAGAARGRHLAAGDQPRGAAAAAGAAPSRMAAGSRGGVRATAAVRPAPGTACGRKSSRGSWRPAILTRGHSSATSCDTVLGHSWISSPPTSRRRPRPPTKRTMQPIVRAGATCWPPLGTARHSIGSDQPRMSCALATGRRSTVGLIDWIVY